jgi:hypothetical protein
MSPLRTFGMELSGERSGSQDESKELSRSKGASRAGFSLYHHPFLPLHSNQEDDHHCIIMADQKPISTSISTPQKRLREDRGRADELRSSCLCHLVLLPCCVSLP